MRKVLILAGKFLKYSMIALTNRNSLHLIVMASCFSLFHLQAKLKWDQLASLPRTKSHLPTKWGCLWTLRMWIFPWLNTPLCNSLWFRQTLTARSIMPSRSRNLAVCISLLYTFVTKALIKLKLLTSKSKEKTQTSKDKRCKQSMKFNQMPRKMIWKIFRRILSKWVDCLYFYMYQNTLI